MTEKNIELKYDILKARVAALIEEHADALALAQMFKKDHDEIKNKLRNAENKISILEGKLKKYDIQKEEPRISIIDGEVDSTEDKS